MVYPERYVHNICAAENILLGEHKQEFMTNLLICLAVCRQLWFPTNLSNYVALTRTLEEVNGWSETWKT